MEQSTTHEMKTVLYDKHVELGAKMVDFSGWKMPLYYQGIIPEHHTVRQQVGLFDISHMGRISIVGNDAERFLDYLSTNHIADKSEGVATYTVWCHENGTCVDDVLIYKLSTNAFFAVVNAANRKKDFAHLLSHAHSFDVRIEERLNEGILALQGPEANQIMTTYFPLAAELKHMHFAIGNLDGEKVIYSRTGYTGTDGFEIYACNSIIIKLWDLFLQEGGAVSVKPIGLGARDTLRLEMGYALYGHELSEEILANESMAAWTIKWDKQDFIGKEALKTLEQSSKKRTEVGLLLLDKGIGREGYPVVKEKKVIGKLTSGGFSPTLNQGVAIAIVEERLQPDEIVEINIRDHSVRAQVVKVPFIRMGSK
jgi:aminomethyltransferase